MRFLEPLQLTAQQALTRVGRAVHAVLSQGLQWGERALEWLDGEHPRLSRAVQSCGAFVRRYPTHLTALTASVLLVGGGGAYAVANLGPDPPLRGFNPPAR